MARTGYEYTTSPRKLEPDYKTSKKTKKRKPKLRVVEDLPREEIKLSKAQKEKRRKLTLVVAAIFLTLLAISYRNSQINEKFNNVQQLKTELSSIEKENEQLKVNIENGLNYNNIEKLGMQKLTSKQTVYVNLPKKDYIEPASEEVVVEKDKNWFEQIWEKITGK